jgi:hypothetical protein
MQQPSPPTRCRLPGTSPTPLSVDQPEHKCKMQPLSNLLTGPVQHPACDCSLLQQYQLAATLIPATRCWQDALGHVAAWIPALAVSGCLGDPPHTCSDCCTRQLRPCWPCT